MVQSAEEMHFQYPHLSLAQIYAALSYYHDYQSEFDAEIERQLKKVDRQQRQENRRRGNACATQGSCLECPETR